MASGVTLVALICLAGAQPYERASVNPLSGVDQRACLPTIVKRCVIHRETRATICFHVKVGCKNELASG